MFRKFAVLAAVSTCLAAWPAAALARRHTIKQFGPGAPGIGDPYFPLDGNGGYDVKHYVLDVAYDPATDVLQRRGDDHGAGDAEPLALQPRPRRPRRPLDQGRRPPADLEPRRRRAHRHAAAGLRKREPLHAPSSRYDGVPEPIGDASSGSRASSTPTTATLVAGQPHVAATWFPVNDHPLDKASYTFEITVPAGPRGDRQRRAQEQPHPPAGWTTWIWDAKEPMASYLTTATIGEFDLRAYREDGIRYWDAIDPDLFTPAAPRTGDQFALSQPADLVLQAPVAHDQRARRRAPSSPSGSTATPSSTGTSCSSRRTRSGSDDWTTLPDLNGHTSQDTGVSLPGLAAGCTRSSPTTRPTTATGRARRPAPPASGGRRPAPATATSSGPSTCPPTPAATSRSRSATPATTSSSAAASSSTTSRSRAARARPRSRTTATRSTAGPCPGRPAGSAPNENDWIVGTAADAPPTVGRRSPRARSPASRRSSRSCRASSAATRSRPPAASSTTSTGSASRWRPRPGRSTRRTSSTSSESRRLRRRPRARPPVGRRQPGARRLAAHLAQRGLRDLRRVAVERARGARRPRRRSSTSYAGIPADDPFWALTIGDPGPDDLFDIPVYDRGAMTLHALRLHDRRRRLLPAPAALGALAARAATSRPRSSSRSPSGLRAGPRRTSSDVAVHAGEAGRDRARRRTLARGPARDREGARDDQEGEEALGPSRSSIHAHTSRNTRSCSGSWWTSWNSPS